MTTLGQHNHFACGGMVREHLLLVNVFFGEVGFHFLKWKFRQHSNHVKYLNFFVRLPNKWKVMGRGSIMDEKLGIKCGQGMKNWGKRFLINENLIQFLHNKWIDEFVTFTRSPRKTWFDIFLIEASWLTSGVKLHMENISITIFFLGWFHLGKHA